MTDTDDQRTLFERVSGKTPEEVDALKKERAERENKLHEMERKRIDGKITFAAEVSKDTSVEATAGTSRLKKELEDEGFEVREFVDSCNRGDDDPWDPCNCWRCNSKVAMWWISWAG